MKVAIYLRVSTLEQANKGNTNRDGFSIPAQREACLRKAETLNAKIIKEYMDRGESARTADRPGLQKLLNDLYKQNNFDYVIVHKIDRLARNLYDDVTIGLAIKKSGAQLISVTENIDETPSGRLLHGIMATIAEFYSRNLASEALKGATEKAKQGGTPYQAPIGYINVTDRINGREVHTIAIDPTKAQLIRWAFERYATGEYTQAEVQKELTRRGLRSKINNHSHGEPLTKNGLSHIFSNRYYMGYVKYNGVEYKGMHQPIISKSLFEKVQKLKGARHGLSRKYKKHFHYLSRLLFCDRCGRHLVYEVSTRGYEYFVCTNRRFHTCELPYIPVKLLEVAVQKGIKQIPLSNFDRKKLVRQIGKELSNEELSVENEIRLQNKRQKQLYSEQDNLLSAYYEKIVDDYLFKRKQKRINSELKQTKAIIKEMNSRLEIVKTRKNKALGVVRNLNFDEVYEKANPEIKRHIILSIFGELDIDDMVPSGQRDYMPRDHQIVIVGAKFNNTLDVKYIMEAVLSISNDED